MRGESGSASKLISFSSHRSSFSKIEWLSDTQVQFRGFCNSGTYLLTVDAAAPDKVPETQISVWRNDCRVSAADEAFAALSAVKGATGKPVAVDASDVF